MIRNGAELKEYYEDLLWDRINWDNSWQALARILVPHDSEITTRSSGGTRQTQHLYDSTGVDALDKLVSAMMGTMFSPVVRWFTLVPRQKLLRDDSDIMLWLELVSDSIFDEINASNFDRVAPGMVNSLAGFGTGALGVEEVSPKVNGNRGFRGLHHIGMPIGTYCIDENAFGNVDTLIRTYWMSARAFMRNWPKADLSVEQRKRLDTKMSARVQIVHGVLPAEVNSPQPYDSWYLLTEIDSVMLPNIAGSMAVELDQGRFPEFPYIVPRWYQISVEF